MADGSNIVTIRDIDVPFFRIVTILKRVDRLRYGPAILFVICTQ